MPEYTAISGYKGFNPDLTCTPSGVKFQYKLGETYEHQGDVEPCKSGFHICLNPLHVFRYYKPGKSKFATVEAGGKTVANEDKLVSSRLSVKLEIGIKDMIIAGVRMVWEKAKGSPSASSGYSSTSASSGDYSTSASSGNSSTSASSGYSSTSASSGNSSTSASSGKGCKASASGSNSIALAHGYGAKAKAALGNWIVLTEYSKDGKKLKSVKSFRIDGKKIKANTFYILNGGKLEVAK